MSASNVKIDKQPQMLRRGILLRYKHDETHQRNMFYHKGE